MITKNLLACLILGMLSSSLLADEFKQSTLFGDNEIVSGGFGGFTMQTSMVDGTQSLFTGMKGAWLINHTFYLGLEGHGLVAPTNVSTTNDLGLGYGGLLVGMKLLPSSVVHFNVEALLGAGGIGEYNTTATSHLNGTAFFASSVAVNAVINVTHIFQIEAGVSYRFAPLYNTTYLSKDALNGMSINLALLFGKF